jgi:hypothetical protein
MNNDKILICDGYKMFKGRMKISPKDRNATPYYITGTWLYKPATDCWYCENSFWSSKICEIIEIE